MPKNTAKKAKKQSTSATDIKKAAIVKSLSQGAYITAACKAAQIDRGTFYDWKAADAKFADATAKALVARVAGVEDALYSKAVKGNVTAQIFFLCNRSKADWQHVHNIHVTGDVKHRITDLANMTISEMLDDFSRRAINDEPKP